MLICKANEIPIVSSIPLFKALLLQPLKFFMTRLLSTDRLYLLPFFALISLILGCGGGGAQKSQPQPQPQADRQPQAEQTRPSETIEAPHEKCSVIVTGDKAGVSYTVLSESDYEGDIKFNCSHDEKQSTAQQYVLLNGVPSLNIVQIRRNTKITSDCILSDSSFTDKLNIDFNYQTGLVASNVISTINGASSCKSKYKSLLATTIASSESILTLFDTWGVDVSLTNKSKSGLIETDCPQTPTKTSNTEVPVCKTTISNHYTVTDDTGKTHTLEKKVSF